MSAAIEELSRLLHIQQKDGGLHYDEVQSLKRGETVACAEAFLARTRRVKLWLPGLLLVFAPGLLLAWGWLLASGAATVGSSSGFWSVYVVMAFGFGWPLVTGRQYLAHLRALVAEAKRDANPIGETVAPAVA